MRQINRLVALVLLFLLLLSLSGCRAGTASTGSETSSAVSSGSTDTNDQTPQPGPPTEPDQDPEPPAPTEVRLLLTYDSALGSTQEGRDRVGAALKAMAETAAGLPVTIIWAEQKEAAAYFTAATADGEVFDLYMGGNDFTALETQGLFSYIRATLIEENAPDFVARMGSVIRPLWTVEEGKKDPMEHSIALFPLYQAASEALYMDFRADLCEAAGYTREDVASMTDWNQVYFLLKDAKAAAGEGFVGLAATRKYDRYGAGFIGPNVICCGSRFADAIAYDNLGDTLNLIASTTGEKTGYACCLWQLDYKDSDPGANPTAAFSFRNAYLEPIDRVNAWYLEGLVWPDSGTDVYPGDSAEIFARVFRASELETELARSDPDHYRVKIVNTIVTAAQEARGYFAVPSSAHAPEAALRILNLIYAEDTAGEWANLLVYGQAGTDYSVGEDGCFTALGETVVYRNAPLGCNPLLLGEWDTEEASLRALQIWTTENMSRTPYCGYTPDFTCDGELLKTLRRLASEYIPRLTWGESFGGKITQHGSIKTSPLCGEFSDALREAGIGSYLRLYQRRLNEWLEQ